MNFCCELVNDKTAHGSTDRLFQTYLGESILILELFKCRSLLSNLLRDLQRKISRLIINVRRLKLDNFESSSTTFSTAKKSNLLQSCKLLVDYSKQEKATGSLICHSVVYFLNAS